MKVYEYILKAKDEFSSAFSKLRGAAGDSESKVDGVKKKLEETAGASKRLDSVVSGLKKTLVAVFAVGAITSFGKSIVDTGAKFEAYQVGFNTLLKDSEKATAVFNQIKEDAKRTPFDTESLVIANRALISAGEGAGKAREVVLDLANAIAATGGTSENLKGMAVNLNQIRSVGKATALDIKQFVFAGIPIYQLLAEATGKTVDEVKDMDVSYNLLAESLKKAAGAGGMFEGGLDKMANSVAGQISNLEEGFTFFKDSLFNLFKPGIVSGLQFAATIMNKVEGVVSFLKDNISAIKQIFSPLMEVINPVIDAFEGIQQKMNQAAGGGSMLQAVFNKIGNILLFLKPLFTAIGNLASTVISKTFEMGMALYNFLNNSKIFSGFVNGFMDMLIKLANGAKNILGGIADLVTGILTFDMDKIKEGFKGLGKGLLEANPISMAAGSAKAFYAGYNSDKKPIDFFTGKKDEQKTGVLAGGGGLGDGGATSDVKSGIDSVSGGGRQAISVNVNFRNFVERMENNFSTVDEGAAEIEDKFIEMFARILNGGIYSATQ